MDDVDRFRLLHGPYRTPRFGYGRVAFCEVRGRVEIVGLTDATIPWPVGKRGRAKSLVVYKGLAKAVRRESAQAVAHWWGVTAQTITVWRKALGVPETNEGTSRLKQAHFAEPWADQTRAKAGAKARDPERREKIAASRRGKPRPPHAIEAMRQARTGKPHSEETRQKMSEAQRRRGTRPPKAGRAWTAEDTAGRVSQAMGQVTDCPFGWRSREVLHQAQARELPACFRGEEVPVGQPGVAPRGGTGGPAQGELVAHELPVVLA